MYFNRQLRWAGPSVNYELNAPLEHAPNYRNLILAAILVSVVFFAGTGAIVNVIAKQSIQYQPNVSSDAPSLPRLPNLPEQQKPASTPAVSAPVAAKDSTAKVQAVLNSWAATHSSQQWSVAIQGLEEDKTQASINADAKYDPASVFKLYFTYTLFQNYSLSSLSNNFVNVDGRGSVSMKDCLDLMIKNSDNPCGVAMGNKIGWGKTTKALKAIGILNTDLNSMSGLSTTAGDMNLFLQQLASGKLIQPDAQQYLLSIMQVQKYRSGIPAGCNDCTVADKTGDLGFVRHDVAIVQYPGGSYTLAIMTNGAPYSQIAQLTSQIQAAFSS
jgi:beta-lactamase class A